jgi:phenylacetate-CoA ligase
MPIFNPEAETMERSALSWLQLERLRNMVEYCYRNVPFYHKKLQEAGITSGRQIHTLEDIAKIPFTTKEELQANYPDGFLAVPKEKIVRIQASSGTTGKPTIGYYTKRDMETWSELSARVLALNGITSDDILQISVGYGLFTGALGFHGGAEKIGCTIVPASTGNTQKQLVMLHDCGVTALMATPSYATYLSELIAHSGIPLEEFKIQRVLFGAERVTKAMRRTVEQNLHCLTADNYGMTECFGPGVSGECEYHTGLHVSEDVFYPEIIDPVRGECLPDGKQGELVFTSLYREAMPLLRYRTRDITMITHEKCQCGRTSCRVKAPMARTDDMFVLKGVNVFPSQIECAMEEVQELSPFYLVVLERDNYKDVATLHVELKEPRSHYTMDQLTDIQNRLDYKMKEIIIVRISIDLLDPGTLERSVGKSIRVKDLRYAAE